MLNYQQNSYAQRERFENVNYGVNTPIDAKKLDDVPQGKVVLSQNVFEELLKVNDESEKAKAEFSYLLTGITEGQTVKFDNIVWCRNNGDKAEADFTPLLSNLNSYVEMLLFAMGILILKICLHMLKIFRYMIWQDICK